MAVTPSSTTSNVTNKVLVSGPFLTFRGAAVYCGYQHPDSFARMLREEKISLPACGPRRNRYACLTLDDFMSNPDAFRASRFARARRHVPKPVSVD
ncbi:hypothetical protein [Humidesulfovibrio sp.]